MPKFQSRGRESKSGSRSNTVHLMPAWKIRQGLFVVLQLLVLPFSAPELLVAPRSLVNFISSIRVRVKAATTCSDNHDTNVIANASHFERFHLSRLDISGKRNLGEKTCWMKISLQLFSTK